MYNVFFISELPTKNSKMHSVPMRDLQARSYEDEYDQCARETVERHSGGGVREGSESEHRLHRVHQHSCSFQYTPK